MREVNAESVHEELSHAVDAGQISRTHANRILLALGAEAIAPRWTVRASINGDEVLLVEGLVAATAEDAIRYVRQDVHVRARVQTVHYSVDWGGTDGVFTRSTDHVGCGVDVEDHSLADAFVQALTITAEEEVRKRTA